MTLENQVSTINRGSFVENIDKRLDRPDYTVDSENISPPVPKLDRQPFLFAPQTFTPLKAIESQTLLKGLETPNERSELYDNFDIYHEQIINSSVTITPKGQNDDGINSMEIIKTN